jgi:hypothetical protein
VRKVSARCLFGIVVVDDVVLALAGAMLFERRRPAECRAAGKRHRAKQVTLSRVPGSLPNRQRWIGDRPVYRQGGKT